MKKSLKVLNLRYQKLAELNDNSPLRARSISCEKRVNEVPQLSFKIPVGNPKLKYLLNEHLIDYDNEYYVIKTPELERSEDGSLYYTCVCSHLSSTLQSNSLTLGEITPFSAEELMQLALEYENGVSKLGWSVGTVEVDSSIKRGLASSEQSSFSMLCTIADTFDCMLRFRSKDRKVDLLKLDDSLKPKLNLTLRKNLKGVKVTYDSSEMVTKLYCFGGEDSFGNELTIMEANPTGKAYIENYSYYKDLGYTDEDIVNNPELFVKTNIWRDSNYVFAEDLYADGIRELERICKPKIELTVTALDTSLVDDYQPALDLNIGDVVIIDDPELGIKFRCYVTERTYDDDEPHILNITISNSVDYRNVLSELFASAKTASQVITSGAVVQGSHINSISTDQVRNLAIEYCSINHLVANYIDANSIAAKYALITDLDAINVTTDTLVATQAEIKSLLAGNIGVGDLQAIHLTTDNVIIDEAVIDELIVSKITVGDILSNSIDTREISIISSDDGSGITIKDSTMKFVDTNGAVRIQIGEDATGNFSFLLTGANGTQLLTDSGLQAGAIANNFIKNNMVDDNAISSRNIDWVSTGASEDENGKPVWDVASLTMNDEKFEVAYTRLQETVDDNTEKTTALGSEVAVVKEQISSKVWNTDIENAINEFNDSEINTIRDQYSSIEQDVNSIESTVSDIRTQTNEMGGVIETLETKITQTEESIIAQVTSIEKMDAKISTIEQTSEGLNVRLESVENGNIEEIKTYYILGENINRISSPSLYPPESKNTIRIDELYYGDINNYYMQRAAYQVYDPSFPEHRYNVSLEHVLYSPVGLVFEMDDEPPVFSTTYINDIYRSDDPNDESWYTAISDMYGAMFCYNEDSGLWFLDSFRRMIYDTTGKTPTSLRLADGVYWNGDITGLPVYNYNSNNYYKVSDMTPTYDEMRHIKYNKLHHIDIGGAIDTSYESWDLSTRGEPKQIMTDVFLWNYDILVSYTDVIEDGHVVLTKGIYFCYYDSDYDGSYVSYLPIEQNDPNYWVSNEPSYDMNSSKELFCVECTKYRDGSASYSEIMTKKSYEASIEAGKTATNYMEFTAEDGLQIGNKRNGVWEGLKTQITSTAFKIIDSAGQTLASYGEKLIELGKNSRDAVISLCGGTSQISNIGGDEYDRLRIYSKDEINLDSDRSIALNNIKKYSDTGEEFVSSKIEMYNTKLWENSLGGDSANGHIKFTVQNGDANLGVLSYSDFHMSPETIRFYLANKYGTSFKMVDGGPDDSGHIEMTCNNGAYLNGYQIATVNELGKTTYSTEETAIGTWIDGKTIYRKIFETGALPKDSVKNIPVNVSEGVDTVITLRGMVSNGDYNSPIPYVVENTSNMLNITYRSSTGNININTYSDRSSYSGYVIFEYTKAS